MYGIAHDDTADGLLNACRADYADDTPRLAYADWLLEHDDPYGEFVRLAVEASAPFDLGPVPEGGEAFLAAAIEARQRLLELYNRYGGNWLGCGWRSVAARPERGLLVVEVPVGTTPETLARVWEHRWPLVAGVSLRAYRLADFAAVRAFLADPRFGLVEVRVVDTLTADRYAALLPEVAGPTRRVLRFVGKAPSMGYVPFRYARYATPAGWMERFTAAAGRHGGLPRAGCHVEVVLDDQSGYRTARIQARRPAAAAARRAAAAAR